VVFERASIIAFHVTQALPHQALNVDPASNFFSGDNGVGFNYTLTERSVFRVFHAAISKGLRVLVYNGDTDPGVNMEAIQDISAAFALQYNLTETQSWRPWTVDGKQWTGGHVTEYDNGIFTFATVKGSGHMVPEFKPVASIVMLSCFLNGSHYPK
jgi:carboxypeptidase C (cathepsin A)